ncbi:MAG TPA: glycosyltransferase family 4 protein [Methylomirabilota bacterium]|jgi:glycosyltransferase involved in cell wall biosynthesis|nr:glycosyltransferase family 4 protein [Methylomirabilota bacterium]
MRICYLKDGVPLCGGVKVTFEQAEALQERGHQVEIVAKADRPDWYDLRVPFKSVDELSPEVIPESDFIIATFWTTVRPAVESGKGRPVHLCQGYEGDTAAFLSQWPEIEAVYQLPVLTLTVHEPLTRLLWRRFGKRAHTVGQGINHSVFFPGPERRGDGPLRILLPGPYEIDWKGVHDGLVALKALKAELPFQAIRVSQLPCTEAEQQFGIVDEYHCHLLPREMAALYWSCDIMLAPSWNQEGFGLPALEAMACGTPVALSDIPAFRGFAEGTDWARFFAERDIRGMQQALRELLTDDGLRRRLRAKGVEIARQYTFARVAERVEQVLRAAGRGEV